MHNRRVAAVLASLAAIVIVAPLLAPYDPARMFRGYPYAPPMRPHIVDDHGAWHAPFAYRLMLVDPLERRYAEDRTRRVTWGSPEPWFLFGSDALARDVLSRLLAGARLSLGISLIATFVALLIGGGIGAAAGYAGGWSDTWLMRLADLVIVLPLIYVVLALRGALPLIMTSTEVFAAFVIVFALVGWPSTARGVRAIVVIESQAEYAEAAKAIGASATRLIARHLLPATRGFLAVQVTVLIPAFIMAEATLSLAGLGFASSTPSWGTMMRDAMSVRTAGDTPWLLAPAFSIVATVFAVHWASSDPAPITRSIKPLNYLN